MRSNCSPIAWVVASAESARTEPIWRAFDFGVLQRAFHERGERAGDGFEIFGARADAAEKVVERLLAARQGGAHAAFRLFERGGGFCQRLQLRADAFGEGAAPLFERTRQFGCLMDRAAGNRAQRLDLVGNLLGCAAGLRCDLGQKALDLLHAARQARPRWRRDCRWRWPRPAAAGGWHPAGAQEPPTIRRAGARWCRRAFRPPATSLRRSRRAWLRWIACRTR